MSNYWNSLYQTRVVANYSDTMAKMNGQDKKAAIDAASNYNSSLVTNAWVVLLRVIQSLVYIRAY